MTKRGRDESLIADLPPLKKQKTSNSAKKNVIDVWSYEYLQTLLSCELIKNLNVDKDVISVIVACLPSFSITKERRIKLSVHSYRGCYTESNYWHPNNLLALNGNNCYSDNLSNFGLTENDWIVFKTNKFYYPTRIEYRIEISLALLVEVLKNFKCLLDVIH